MLLTAAFGAAALEAQDHKAPKEFFKKGYVNDPQADVARDSAESVPKNQEGQNETDLLTPKLLEGLKQPKPPTPQPEKPESEITPAPDEAAADVMEKEGRKVKSLSIILSPDNVEHFRKHYKEFLKLRDNYGLILKNVYIVGDAEKLLDSPENEVFSEGVEGGIFRYLNELPPPFAKVQTSPTYVLDTSQGGILVEGFSSILRCFNKRGEFIEPETAP